MDAWAQSNTIPGFFTGSTGAQVLSSEDLSTTGPQAWLKKVWHTKYTNKPFPQFLFAIFRCCAGPVLTAVCGCSLEPLVSLCHKATPPNFYHNQKITSSCCFTKLHNMCKTWFWTWFWRWKMSCSDHISHMQYWQKSRSTVLFTRWVQEMGPGTHFITKPVSMAGIYL